MLAALGLACDPAPAGQEGAPAVAAAGRPLVYGQDGRREWYDHPDRRLRALARNATVALVPGRLVTVEAGRVRLAAPTLAERDGLCPGERFASQPSPALCTGVLVAPDLVLTAGHCLLAEPCSTLRVVFDFRYQAPGTLAPIEERDVHRCREVVALEVSPADAPREVDHAWIRLDRPAVERVPAVLAPTAHRSRAAAPAAVVSHGQGIPAKLDDSGRIFSVRPDNDYFVLSADLFHGASGAAVYDADYRVIGVVGRGGRDYVVTQAGCRRVLTLPEEVASVDEQATTIDAARAGLCARHPEAGALCVPSSGASAAAGCSVGGSGQHPGGGRKLASPTGLMFLLFTLRRLARSAGLRGAYRRPGAAS